MSLTIGKPSVGTAERGNGFGNEPHRSSGAPSLALLPTGPSGDVISLSAGRETSRESFLQAQIFSNMWSDTNQYLKHYRYDG
jgi:hypothetical protein